jgi:hypothetical protein
MNLMPENKWTVETDMSEYKSFNNYMLQNIKMEQELWERQQYLNKGVGVVKINRYFNASPVKRMASRFFVEAAIDVNVDYTPTKIATLMKVSRSAICKISNECIAEGWVEEYDIKGVRYVQATQYQVDVHIKYLETLTEMRNKYVTDFCAAYKLFKSGTS